MYVMRRVALHSTIFQTLICFSRQAAASTGETKEAKLFPSKLHSASKENHGVSALASALLAVNHATAFGARLGDVFHRSLGTMSDERHKERYHDYRPVSHSLQRNDAPLMLFGDLKQTLLELTGQAAETNPSKMNSTERREFFKKMIVQYGVQQPMYDIVAEGDGYEVRKFQPMTVVQCYYIQRPEGYDMLGGYFVPGGNKLGIRIPATVPAMMFPFPPPEMQGIKVMRFMLPSPHTPIDPEDEPLPPPEPAYNPDNEISFESLPEITYAVAGFGNIASPDVVARTAEDLAAKLVQQGYRLPPDALGKELVLAQYNEVYNMPWNRNNEVWVPVFL